MCILYLSDCPKYSNSACNIQVNDQIYGFSQLGYDVDLVVFSNSIHGNNKFNAPNLRLVEFKKRVFFSYFCLALDSLFYTMRNAKKYKIIYGRSLKSILFCSLLHPSCCLELHESPSAYSVVEIFFLQILFHFNRIKIFVTTPKLGEQYSTIGIKSVVLPDACSSSIWSKIKKSLDKTTFSNEFVYTGGLFDGKVSLPVLQKIALFCADHGFVLRIEGDWSKASYGIRQLLKHPSTVTSGKFLSRIDVANIQCRAAALICPYPDRTYSQAHKCIDSGLSPLKLYEYLCVLNGLSLLLIILKS